jgi:group I intron endonuclease
MEKYENVYENGFVYKIVSKNTEKIYIGSTSISLEKRLKQHEYMSATKQKKTQSFEIIKYGDYEIKLLESFENISEADLRRKETEFIRKFEHICVNIGVPIKRKRIIRTRKIFVPKTDEKINEILEREMICRKAFEKEFEDSWLKTIWKKGFKHIYKKAKQLKEHEVLKSFNKIEP